MPRPQSDQRLERVLDHEPPHGSNRNGRTRNTFVDPAFVPREPGMASLFTDDSRRLRTTWRFAIFGCGFLAIQIVVGILVVVGLVIYMAATGTSLDALARNPRMLD